jgi:hypothetical protein
MEIVHSMPVTRSHLEMSTLIIDEYVKAHSIILRRLRNLIIEQITLGTSPVCDHNLHQELSQLVSKGYIRKLNSDEFSVYKGITYNKSIGEWNKRFPRVLYDKN